MSRLKPSRLPEWTVVVFLSASFALFYYFAYLRPAPLKQPEGRKVRWFFLVRLPELPSNPIGTNAGKKRLAEWLQALDAAGFKPILLSDAIGSLLENKEIPRKAIALSYEPGFLQTHENAAPLLAQHRSPATWITDRDGIENSDRQYLSKHAIGLMKHGGMCDIGYFQISTATFSLEGSNRSSYPGKKLDLRWAADAGRVALNTPATLTSLNRLNVNIGWTGSELVERLKTEIPLETRSAMITTRLFGRTWGVLVPAYSHIPLKNAGAFDLKAPPDARGLSVIWNGTKGCPNVRIELNARAVIGEFWVYLRYDPETEQGLRVGFTPERILIEQAEGKKEKRLAAVAWTFPRDRHLQSTILLTGHRLELTVLGSRLPPVAVPATPVGKEALVLAVHSKIRGAAQAKAIRMFAAPL